MTLHCKGPRGGLVRGELMATDFRALDAEVAEKVMTGPHAHWRDPVPNYSTSWDAAGLVVEHFERNLWDVVIKRQNGHWNAAFCRPSYEFGAWAETLPTAVCRAALKAIADS